MIAFVLCCVAGDCFLKAENLVPNGNFEEEKNGAVLNWQQPLGLYYHYEKRWVKRERMKLDAINGICFVSPHATEYLQVKLNESLQAGEACRLQMEIMRSSKDNAWSQSTPEWIEVYFCDTQHNATTRTLITGQPQIQFISAQVKTLLVY